jgi:hypothetical protein
MKLTKEVFISCITMKIVNRMTMIRMKNNPSSANSKISTTNNLGSLSKSRTKTNSKHLQTKNQFLTAYHNACQELILIYTGPLIHFVICLIVTVLSNSPFCNVLAFQEFFTFYLSGLNVGAL